MNAVNDVMYNINIERSLLSSIMFDDEGSRILSLLSKEHFYFPFHQHCFATLLKMFMENKPLTEDFLMVELQKANAFDEVAFIDMLAVSPIVNYTPYINELIGRSQRREVFRLATIIKKEAIEDTPIEEILQSIGTRIEKIADKGVMKLKKLPIESVKAEKPEFWCKDWLPLPVGVATMISGIGGTGKGWLALQLAMRLAREGKKSYLWFSEDVKGIVRERYDSIKKSVWSFNFDPNLIHITDEPPMFFLDSDKYTSKVNDKFYGVRRELNEYDMILFDPLLAFYGGDENSNSQARIFMQPFMNWAMQEGKKKKAIVFLHHSKKDGGGFRGAGAFMDAMRSGYEVETHTLRKNGKDIPNPKMKHLKRVTLLKDNYGASLHTKYQVDRHLMPWEREYKIVVEDSVPPITKQQQQQPLPDLERLSDLSGK